MDYGCFPRAILRHGPEFSAVWGSGSESGRWTRKKEKKNSVPPLAYELYCAQMLDFTTGLPRPGPLI